MPLKRHFRNLWRNTEKLGLDGGLGEEHGPIGENWGYDGVKVELGRRE